MGSELFSKERNAMFNSIIRKTLPFIFLLVCSNAYAFCGDLDLERNFQTSSHVVLAKVIDVKKSEKDKEGYQQEIQIYKMIKTYKGSFLDQIEVPGGTWMKAGVTKSENGRLTTPTSFRSVSNLFNAPRNSINLLFINKYGEEYNIACNSISFEANAQEIENYPKFIKHFSKTSEFKEKYPTLFKDLEALKAAHAG